MSASVEFQVDAYEEKLETGQYWENSSISASFRQLLWKKNSYMVQCFEATKNVYLLNDSLKFEVLLEGFVRRVERQLIPVERKRACNLF